MAVELEEDTMEQLREAFPVQLYPVSVPGIGTTYSIAVPPALAPLPRASSLLWYWRGGRMLRVGDSASGPAAPEPALLHRARLYGQGGVLRLPKQCTYAKSNAFWSALYGDVPEVRLNPFDFAVRGSPRARRSSVASNPLRRGSGAAAVALSLSPGPGQST
eukprot:1097406-Rhodomonas_salina.1